MTGLRKRRMMDRELTTAPGLWRGRAPKPANEHEALNRWSPAVMAWAMERGYVSGWPFELTRRGRRWLADRKRGKGEPIGMVSTS